MNNKEDLLKYLNLQATNEYLQKKIFEMQAQNNIGYKMGTIIDGIIRVKNRNITRIHTWKRTKSILHFSRDGLNTTEKREKPIIVSLTSYPERLKYVPATIGSLLKQTVKPDRIILWLGKEQSKNKHLPKIFKEMTDAGLEIKYRMDIKTHTKWFYAFKEYPNALIITVDDDVIYDSNVIEKLYHTYLKYPESIPALRVHRLRFTDNKDLMSYDDWNWEYSNTYGAKSYQFFATGVGGVLYQPNEMCSETLNLKNIRKYCPSEDDAWLKIMEVLSNKRVVLADNVSKVNGVTITGSQKFAMWKENVIAGGSDRQIREILPIYEHFKGENYSLIETMALDGIIKASF